MATNMNIPQFFYTQSDAYRKICDMADTISDDAEFGKYVRDLLTKIKEGKVYRHSDHELDFANKSVTTTISKKKYNDTKRKSNRNL